MTPLAIEAIPAPPADYSAILAPLVLLGAAMAILALIAIKRAQNTTPYVLLTVVAAAGSAAASLRTWGQVESNGGRFAFSGMVAADGFAAFAALVVAVVVILAVLLTDGYLRREGIERAEYFVLLLMSAAGMQLMAMSNNLLMIFLSLELLSIALYVLAAFARDRAGSQEAGMKYLLLGAYSSAFLLYGIAMIYGGTGTTNLAGIAKFFASTVQQNSGLVYIGIGLTVVGLGFKIAAVPFHMWTPDVYQGAPTPVVAFMAAGAKLAGFAALFRVLETAFPAYRLTWQPLMWGLAVLTMLVGAILAIVQTDAKRLLAYSSISHAGFILIGLVAANGRGRQGALFYLLAYSFMVVGAFAVVMVVARRDERHTSLEDYRGLFRRQPVLAGLLAFFLFAMAGIPGTSGFVAKFSVFAGAAAAHQWVLVAAGTVSSVIAAYLYLRLVVLMYMTPEDEALDPDASPLRVPAGVGLALGLCVLFTLQLGILPEGVLEMARKATLLF